jgi:hypothetical protein
MATEQLERPAIDRTSFEPAFDRDADADREAETLAGWIGRPAARRSSPRSTEGQVLCSVARDLSP